MIKSTNRPFSCTFSCLVNKLFVPLISPYFPNQSTVLIVLYLIIYYSSLFYSKFKTYLRISQILYTCSCLLTGLISWTSDLVRNNSAFIHSVFVDIVIVIFLARQHYVGW